MKKGVKIALIVVPLVLVLLGGTICGYLYFYSKNNITYNLGDTTVTGYIAEIIIVIPPSINYTGYVLVEYWTLKSTMGDCIILTI